MSTLRNEELDAVSGGNPGLFVLGAAAVALGELLGAEATLGGFVGAMVDKAKGKL